MCEFAEHELERKRPVKISMADPCTRKELELEDKEWQGSKELTICRINFPNSTHLYMNIWHWGHQHEQTRKQEMHSTLSS